MQIDLSVVVLVVLFGSMLSVAAASVISRYREKSAENDLKDLRVVCRLCGKLFLCEHQSKIVHCQHCGHLNLQKKNGHLG